MQVTEADLLLGLPCLARVVRLQLGLGQAAVTLDAAGLLDLEAAVVVFLRLLAATLRLGVLGLPHQRSSTPLRLAAEDLPCGKHTAR